MSSEPVRGSLLHRSRRHRRRRRWILNRAVSSEWTSARDQRVKSNVLPAMLNGGGSGSSDGTRRGDGSNTRHYTHTHLLATTTTTAVRDVGGGGETKAARAVCSGTLGSLT